MPQDAEQNAPNVWPPAPKLGPPLPAPRPKLLPMKFLTGLSVCGCLFIFAARVAVQWFRHKPVLWASDAQFAVQVIAITVAAQLLGRFIFTRQQEIKAAQEAAGK